MERMRIKLISVVDCNGITVALAKADAPDAGAQIWVQVEFQQSDIPVPVEQEAYDRVLSVLDPA